MKATILLAGMFALLGTTAATAQMSAEEAQRCIWQCLYNSPGAESRQYRDCVSRMCEAPAEQAAPRQAAPKQTPLPQAPRGVWTSGGGRTGEHFAGVEIPGAALTFICRPDGSAMIGIGGVGGRGDRIEFRVDRQAYGLDFRGKNNILLTNVPPRSQLVRAIMGGGAVHVTDRASGRSVSFPLTGSGGAITEALAGCGLRP